MMVRLSLVSHGSFSIQWFEGMPVREFFRWTAIITEELDKMAEELSPG